MTNRPKIYFLGSGMIAVPVLKALPGDRAGGGASGGSFEPRIAHARSGYHSVRRRGHRHAGAEGAASEGADSAFCARTAVGTAPGRPLSGFRPKNRGMFGNFAAGGLTRKSFAIYFVIQVKVGF